MRVRLLLPPDKTKFLVREAAGTVVLVAVNPKVRNLVEATFSGDGWKELVYLRYVTSGI